MRRRAETGQTDRQIRGQARTEACALDAAALRTSLVLFADERLPVEHHGNWGGWIDAGWPADEEALAVGSDVVGVARADHIGLGVNREDLRLARVERRTRRDGHRHELTIAGDEEQLCAVAAPPRFRSARA